VRRNCRGDEEVLRRAVASSRATGGPFRLEILGTAQVRSRFPSHPNTRAALSEYLANSYNLGVSEYLANWAEPPYRNTRLKFTIFASSRGFLNRMTGLERPSEYLAIHRWLVSEYLVICLLPDIGILGQKGGLLYRNTWPNRAVHYRNTWPASCTRYRNTRSVRGQKCRNTRLVFLEKPL